MLSQPLCTYRYETIYHFHCTKLITKHNPFQISMKYNAILFLIRENVNPRTSPSHNIYQEVTDVFCFSRISSMIFALWFIYGSEHKGLYILNVLLLLPFWGILRQYGFPPATVLEYYGFIMKCLHIASNKDDAYIIFVLGLALVLIGVTGISLTITFY